MNYAKIEFLSISGVIFSPAADSIPNYLPFVWERPRINRVTELSAAVS